MKQIKRNTPDNIIEEVVNEIMEADQKKTAKTNDLKQATEKEIEEVMQYLNV